MARESTKTPDTDLPEGEIPEAALPGQITNPNPVEVFWEKHKIKVWLGLILIGLAYGGWKFMEYQKRQNRNALWSSVSEATGLASNLEPSDVAMSIFGGGYGLEKSFGDSLDDKSPEDLAKVATETSDTGAKAVVLWYLARRYAQGGDVAKTKSTIADLAKVAPDFPPLLETPAPPSFIELPELDEDDPKNKKARENPDLPPAGKISDKLIAYAERQAAFKAANAKLYDVPTPADKPVVRMETSEGTIVIKLYPEQAPKHVAQFLENCKAKLYDDMSFHSITRKGQGMFADMSFRGELAAFGDPETKQDDRTKWGQFKSEKEIEGELSGISHFPFMLAADRNTDQKGSDTQRCYFTATNFSDRDDGYVVFGRVVEGQDVIKAITSKPLNSAQETQSGTGIPATPVTITKVTVEE